MKKSKYFDDVVVIAEEFIKRFGDRAEAEVSDRVKAAFNEKEAEALWIDVRDAVKALRRQTN